MKKIIIGSLVGAVILLIWNSLSWMVLPFHQTAFKYTSAQDEIMYEFRKSLTEEGMFYIPNIDPELPAEDLNAAMEGYDEKYMGKPWAMILYNKNYDGMQGKNFIFMILFQLISVLFISWMLYSASDRLPTGFSRWLFVMAVPMFIVLNGEMAQWNWFSFPMHYLLGFIIDHFAGWAIVGFFLAWYYKE